MPISRGAYFWIFNPLYYLSDQGVRVTNSLLLFRLLPYRPRNWELPVGTSRPMQDNSGWQSPTLTNHLRGCLVLVLCSNILPQPIYWRFQFLIFQRIKNLYYVSYQVADVDWFKIRSLGVRSKPECGVNDTILPLIWTRSNHYRGVWLCGQMYLVPLLYIIFIIQMDYNHAYQLFFFA